MADFSSWATQSSPYDDQISEAEKKYGLPSGFLRKQLIAESNLNPKAASNAPNSHATGIAQFQPGTAAEMGIDPKDATQSIDAAAKKDAQLYQQFGSWGKALVAYHDGPGAVAEGRISPEAVQYRQNFMSVPDYKAGQDQSSAPAQGDDPFAQIDQAHGAAGGAAGDPFAQIDAAHGASASAPASSPAAAGSAPDPEAAARAAYDAKSVPQRIAQSAGTAVEDAIRGSQQIGADIGHGVGSILPSWLGGGALTQAADQERAKLAQQEAAAAPTRAGEHGWTNVVGQALPYVATAPIGGAEAGAANLGGRVLASAGRNALLGGAMGAAAPTQEQGIGNELEQRAKNAVGGAVAGGVLGPLVEGLGTTAGKIGKGIANKLTDYFGGPERTAAARINSLTPEGHGAPDFSAGEKVPGYTPSLAEASQDPRVAELDRQMRANHDDYRAAADAVDANNNDAIHSVIDSIRGDRSSLAQLYQERSDETGPMYDAAAKAAQAAGARVDTNPVYKVLVDTAKAHQGQTSVTNVLNQYLKPGSLVDELPDGRLKLTNDIQRLTNVRNQISTDLGKQFSTDSAGNDMKAAARPLMQVRDVIDQQLGEANPALAEARERFAQMSTGINQQEALQSVLSPDKDGKGFTSTKIANALNTLQNQQAKSGAKAAKALTPEQIQQLQDVHDVLAARETARAAKPGADLKSQARDIATGVSNRAGWNALLGAENLHGGIGGLAGTALGGALGFVAPGIGHTVGTTLGTLAGGSVGNMLGRASARQAEKQMPAIRNAIADYLLDPRGKPTPNVSPSAYSRTNLGQRVVQGTGAGATSNAVNHLTGE